MLFFQVLSNFTFIFFRFFQDLRQGRVWKCLWSESRSYYVDQKLAHLQKNKDIRAGYLVKGPYFSIIFILF